MAEYKLKTPKAIEKTVVGAYKKIESGVTETYKKIEDAFVHTFLEETPSLDASAPAKPAKESK